MYVDACRYLPEDVLISRVRLEVWTSDADEIVGVPAFGLCELDSNVNSPVYSLRHEYRESSFDPTCTIEVQVEAFEEHSKQLKLVGCAVLNVFNNKHRQTPTICANGIWESHQNQ